MNMVAKRSALVVGATGFVGTKLVQLLCNSKEYGRVKLIVRRPVTYSHPKLEVLVRDFDNITYKDIGVVQDVFCCLGTTIKKAGSREAFQKVDFQYPRTIAALAKKQKVEHFIMITAVGANEKSWSHYNRVKGPSTCGICEKISFYFRRTGCICHESFALRRNEQKVTIYPSDKIAKFAPL
ncbi:NAD(P)H-binding protein [Paenibacillus apiarius]|uniref:NAD(P)H-binding protein n=1 Tax=Paenibacillus apiarius TaxID=46240 RepID=UPI003B3BD9CE